MLLIWPLCFIHDLDKTLTRFGILGYIFPQCVGQSSRCQRDTNIAVLQQEYAMLAAPTLSLIGKIYITSSKDLLTFFLLLLWLKVALIEINIGSSIMIAMTFPHFLWTCSKTSSDLFHAHNLIRSCYALIRSSHDQLTIIMFWGLCHKVNRCNGGISRGIIHIDHQHKVK